MQGVWRVDVTPCVPAWTLLWRSRRVGLDRTWWWRPLQPLQAIVPQRRKQAVGEGSASEQFTVVGHHATSVFDFSVESFTHFEKKDLSFLRPPKTRCAGQNPKTIKYVKESRTLLNAHRIYPRQHQAFSTETRTELPSCFDACAQTTIYSQRCPSSRCACWRPACRQTTPGRGPCSSPPNPPQCT